MTDASQAAAPMGLFARYLTLWVALAMIAGIVIGQFAPGLVQAIAGAELAAFSQNPREFRGFIGCTV